MNTMTTQIGGRERLRTVWAKTSGTLITARKLPKAKAVAQMTKIDIDERVEAVKILHKNSLVVCVVCGFCVN